MNNANKWRKWFGLTVLAACGTGLLLPASYAVAAAPASSAQTTKDAAVTQSKVAMAGNFEGKALHSKQHGTFIPNDGHAMGAGWAATDDQRMSGHSSASIRLVHPGAGGTHGALEVSGELKSGFIAPWAGAVWFPGTRPMQPADLSGDKTLTFRVRGKPGSYSIMLMSGSMQSIPQYADFTITKDWKQVSIPLQGSFPGADFKQVYFVAFSAGALGKFQFQLDHVTLTD